MAQPSLLTPQGRPDYANPATWLCRPDLTDNRCKVDLDATVIAPSGAMSIEKFAAAKAPKIDCFFVYPTVSKDPGWQSDLTPDDMEWDDIRIQFARFGKVCRQFAPMYRQGTLTALRYPSGGPKPVGERPAPGVGGYNDVVDAWNWYLAHENKGRGVVLIGHSQGAAMVERLIAQEIDGKPVQKQLVSAVILGSAVMVPPGQDVGGTFKSIRLCHADDQVGCVITYASFRDRVPPPESSRFGRARDGLQAACTNPANLKGGSGAPESYFLTKGFLNGSGGDAQPPWTRPARPISTPFVKTPGLVSTQCVTKGEFTYLAVHVNPNPKGHRTDELGGQILRHTGVDASWGLHLIDVDHSMGTLNRVVASQGAAYERGVAAR
ncbi:DUF3089 domain-containing protein [Phenylobacterium sp.]|uniref:DUF3089 domain-containing protein n=1 Tax=Phenylobacterium sp. TaxID=1871053 RepID=UPI0025D285BA|nr:DUF3089 domain-containing protein [Phenylobacterium sp.]